MNKVAVEHCIEFHSPDLLLIPYIANHWRWRSFVVFADRSVPRNFSSEIVCSVGLAMQNYYPTVNVFQQIKFSFATAKPFYLERFAIYGI